MGKQSQTKEMSFLDHLEELRWHLVRSGIAVLVFGIAAFWFKEFIWHQVLLAPSRTDFYSYRVLCKLGELLSSPTLCITELPFSIQSRTMAGQFTMHLTSSIIIGIVVGFPYIFWEIWLFVKPALHDKEVRYTRGITFVVSLLFFTGVFFGYYFITPLTVNFLSSYRVDPSIINQIDITSYVSTVTVLVLSTGLIFQLPIVVFFLAKVGIATPAFMKHYRKHAVVVIFILSAIITPPDVISQILLSIPLILLYQVSISIARMVEKEKEKAG